jgi:adenylate kinase family enzyme
MGGPCSGKKEYAMLMAEEFGYTYISTGEILRNEIGKVSLKKLLNNLICCLGHQRRRQN